MKKIILLLLFILLISCEDGVERPIVEIHEPVADLVLESKVLSKPEILIESVYDTPQTFIIKDVIKGHDTLVVEVDNLIVEDSFTLDYGKHKIVTYYFEDDKESPHAYLNVTIVDDISKVYTKLYDSIGGSSINVLTDSIRSTHVYKSVFQIEDGEIEEYFYIEDDYMKGYFIAPAGKTYNVNSVDFICDKGKFVLNGELTAEPILVKDYYSVKSQFGDYLIHTETAEFIELRNMILSFTGKYMLVNKERAFELYTYDDDYKLLYTKEWTDNEYVRGFFVGDEFRFTIEYHDESLSSLLGEDYLESYRFDDKTLDVKPLKNKRDTFFDLYENHTYNSRYLGKVHYSDLVSERELIYTELSEQGINEWLEVDGGYVNIESNNYRFHNQLYDNKGNKLAIDLSISDELPNHEGFYILIDSQRRYYIYNAFKNEMLDIDTEKILSQGDIVIAHSEDKIDIYEFEDQDYVLKDTVETSLENYLVINWFDDGFDIVVDGREVNYHLIYDKITSIRKVEGHYVLVDKPLEEIIIYQEANRSSDEVGIIDFDLGNIAAIGQFEFIENELMAWYEVSQGELKGYVYIPLDPYEHTYVDTEIFNLKFALNDGSIADVTLEGFMDYRIANEYSHLNYYVLELGYEYGKTYLINRDTGEAFIVEGYIDVSPKGKSICAVYYKWHEGNYYVRFYEMNDRNIIEKNYYSFYGWEYNQFNWVSEYEVEFVWDTYNKKEVLGLFKLSNDNWDFESQ